MRKGTGSSVTSWVMGDLDVWWVWALAAGEGVGGCRRGGRRPEVTGETPTRDQGTTRGKRARVGLTPQMLLQGEAMKKSYRKIL